jgi:hypothetical protein
LDEADDFLMDHYLPFLEKHQDEMTPEMKQALWEFTTKDFPVYNQAMTNLPRYPWSEVEAFVEKELKAKDAEDDEPVSIVRHFIRKQAIQSMDWLNEWGYCQDHIKPAPSTLESAGRGAFATRDIPKGYVAGYAPLVHIGQWGREIFDITYSNVGGVDGERHAYDLMINYSFGHANSSVILTPYGGMVNYINHASGDKANVKVRWPDRPLVAHKPAWLDEDIPYLRDTIEKIGLSFEYVALRDIKEGKDAFCIAVVVCCRVYCLRCDLWTRCQRQRHRLNLTGTVCDCDLNQARKSLWITARSGRRPGRNMSRTGSLWRTRTRTFTAPSGRSPTFVRLKS